MSPGGGGGGGRLEKQRLIHSSPLTHNASVPTSAGPAALQHTHLQTRTHTVNGQYRAAACGAVSAPALQ